MDIKYIDADLLQWNGNKTYQPISERTNYLSLGEGNTPLIKIDNIANRLGLKNLFAKLEYISPTGSFKDRGSSLVINIAKKTQTAIIPFDPLDFIIFSVVEVEMIGFEPTTPCLQSRCSAN